MKLLMAVILAGILSSCVTPMPQSEVEALTTCGEISIATVRKNLLLNGWVIDKESPTDLVTDFKQTDYWHGDRRFVRITAVDLGNRIVKLKVRVKSIRIHRDDGIGVGVSGFDWRYRQSNSIVFDFSRPIEVEDEDDETYVEGSRERYHQLKREACGL